MSAEPMAPWRDMLDTMARQGDALLEAYADLMWLEGWLAGIPAPEEPERQQVAEARHRTQRAAVRCRQAITGPPRVEDPPPPPGPAHVGDVWHDSASDGWRSGCSCGWRDSEVWLTEERAQAACERHRRVEEAKERPEASGSGYGHSWVVVYLGPEEFEARCRCGWHGLAPGSNAAAELANRHLYAVAREVADA